MPDFKKKSLVLAGDIGGTKTNIGLFEMGKRRPIRRLIEVYSSKDASGLESIIEQFFGKYPVSINHACFGIAGPVINGQCRTTNLPWYVSENRIRKRFKWKRVRLLNDLTATVEGVPLLNSRELLPLNKRVRKAQNIALIAPGTGLGEALLVFKEGKYSAVSSEGGHADFSPNTDAELQLWFFLHKQFGHVSKERVLSGPGLFNIYSWFKDSGRYSEPSWLRKRIEEIDPAKAVTDAAMNKNTPICVATLNMFVSILGAVAGNLALIGMATGGVFLGGGIPPKILSILQNGLFMEAFVNKGRFEDFLKKIPVRVIINDKAALLGAAKCAFEL
ncbi:MAG: glucokinase [Desulfobacterales bacterium]|nr:glucokinase [Desulfobacterales bacterium]